MKIRKGFVSNSSSSSFCLYGVCIDESEMVKAFIKKGYGTEEDFEESIYEWLDDWSFEYDLKQKGLSKEEIEVKLDDRPLSGFEFEDMMGYSQFLGIAWNHIKDDETGAEFKARIEAKMKDIFGEDTECSTHAEAWGDS